MIEIKIKDIIFPLAPTVGAAEEINKAVCLQQESLAKLLEFAKNKLVEVKIPEIREKYVKYWEEYAKIIDETDPEDSLSLFTFILSIGSCNDAEGKWAGHVLGILSSYRGWAEDVIYHCESVIGLIEGKYK